MPAPKRPARGRRKVKKNIPVGQAHIKTSFNNTIVSLTDLQGNVIATSAALYFQQLSPFIGNVLEVEADVVNQAVRCAGGDGNIAVDAIPLAVKSTADGLRDLQRRRFCDLDHHGEILDRDRPSLGRGSR